MPIYQAYNGRIKAWVKYEVSKKGWKVVNVKQQNPKKPFKNVPKKGNKRK